MAPEKSGNIFWNGIIMFIRVKAIRKGTKPPVWRRVFIPMEITFAQLAFILETVLELPLTDRYEFEFFQEKDRMIEGDSPVRTIRDLEFDYRNAVKTVIKDWVLNRTWFTFCVNTEGEAQPRYRVEIEGAAQRVLLGSEKEPLDHPLIMKETSSDGDRFWSSMQELNRKLRRTCIVTEGKAEYPDFASVCGQVRKGKGIRICSERESQGGVLQDPETEMSKEIHDRIEQLQKRIDELNREIEARKAEAARIRAGQNTAPAAEPENKGPARTRSVEDLLKRYRREDLTSLAKDYGCKLHASSRAGMAHELARHVLEPDFMRERLLEMDESELDAFEGVISKGRHFPGQDELDQLDGFLYLDYVGEISDGTIEVPEDAETVYGIICARGYRDFHRKAHWLTDCLCTFGLLYAVGRTDLLYRLYCLTDRFKADRAEFESILKKIPDRLNACRRIGDRIVAEGATWDRMYLEIEESQRNVPWYIPSESEILDYARNGYPVSDPAYRRLYDFFHKEMGIDKEDCREYCRKNYDVFSLGGSISDYMEYLNEEMLSFRSDRQVEKLVKIVTETANNTRMFELKGHTPMEMRAFAPLIQPGMKQKIVPMSSTAAKLLEEGREQMEAMGFDVDTDSTGTVIPMMGFGNGPSGGTKAESRKIYPNDLCPCGSGKKYKKCCGKKSGLPAHK